MREGFAHDATMTMRPAATRTHRVRPPPFALCAHSEHEPPCPLAPKHTRTERTGDLVRLRILFAAAQDLEGEVRNRIGKALRSSQLVCPDGMITTWQLETSTRGAVLEQEANHVGRLIAT